MSARTYAANTWKIAFSMSSADSTFTLGVYVLYLLWLGLSLAETSFVISLWLLVSALAETPTGIFADRYGHKQALCWGGVATLIGTVLLAFADSFADVAVSYAFLGLGFSMKSGADHALLYEGLKHDGREKAYRAVAGRLGFAVNLFWTTASILGGVLYAFSPRLPFYLEIAVVAAGLLAALALREPPRDHHASLAGHLRESVRLAVRMRGFSLLFVFSALIGSLAVTFMQYAQPVYAARAVPESWFGLVTAAMYIMRGFGARHADAIARRVPLPAFLRGYAAVYVLVPAIVLLAPTAWVALPAVALAYFFRGLYVPVVYAYVNERVDAKNRATMLSLNHQLLAFTTSMSLLGTGYLAQTGGYVGALYGVAVLAFALVAAFSVAASRR